MLIIVLQVSVLDNHDWILDSGCSRHLTGDKSLLKSFREKAGPVISFGDNSKGYTMGYGTIEAGMVILENVAFVQGLKHNLISVSQLGDKGFETAFNKFGAKIFSLSGEKVLSGSRKGNIYIADLSSATNEACLVSK